MLIHRCFGTDLQLAFVIRRSGKDFKDKVSPVMDSLVFEKPMFRILALYLDCEGAKNINVLYVPIWSCGGFCMPGEILSCKETPELLITKANCKSVPKQQ